MMRRTGGAVMVSLCLTACGIVDSSVEAKLTIPDATADVTGALLHVNPGGAFTGGKQFTFNFSLAKVTFTPTDTSTYHTLTLDFSTDGAVQAKTYQSTDTDGCLGMQFSTILNSAGTGFRAFGGAAAACTVTGMAVGSWSADITDASAPHGTITTTLLDDNGDPGDTLANTMGSATITF